MQSFSISEKVLFNFKVEMEQLTTNRLNNWSVHAYYEGSTKFSDQNGVSSSEAYHKAVFQD